MKAAVLHVTNRWGGGVKASVQRYVAAMPDYRHYLLYGPDPWHVEGDVTRTFEASRELPVSIRKSRRALTEAIRDFDVDVVHAHSSHAGVLARLVPTNRHVVYTPHAFASLAPRYSRVWAAGQVEWVLGRRPITYAAVSDSEARLASRYSPRSRVVRIVNLPNPELGPAALTYSPAPRIVMCGRICPQKGSDFFARTAGLYLRRNPNASFAWLGDGDAEGRRQLERAGVEVSGWLTSDGLRRAHVDATVYLHSARYEGACLSVLDAAALGLPSIGRPVPGVAEVPWLSLAATPAAAVDALILLEEPGHWGLARKAALEGVAALTTDLLRQQLAAAYHPVAISSPSDMVSQ